MTSPKLGDDAIQLHHDAPSSVISTEGGAFAAEAEKSLYFACSPTQGLASQAPIQPKFHQRKHFHTADQLASIP